MNNNAAVSQMQQQAIRNNYITMQQTSQSPDYEVKQGGKELFMSFGLMLAVVVVALVISKKLIDKFI